MCRSNAIFLLKRNNFFHKMKKLPNDELNTNITQSSTSTSISKSSYSQKSYEMVKSSIRHEYNTQRAYFSPPLSTEPSTSYRYEFNQNKN